MASRTPGSPFWSMLSPESDPHLLQPVERDPLPTDDGPAAASLYPLSLPSADVLYGALFESRGLEDPRDPLSLSAISADVHHDSSVVDDIRREAASRPSNMDENDAEGERHLSWTAALISVSGDIAGQEQQAMPSSRAIEEPAPNKKPRGRPRVEARDETAVDRRRTQIRLAQRAYRHRKESTISSLRERIVELENVLDEMNSAFLQFNDHAVERGIVQSHPEIAGNLKKTTQQFLALARRTHGAAEEGSPTETRNEGSVENSDENPNIYQDSIVQQPPSEAPERKRRRGGRGTQVAPVTRRTTASMDPMGALPSSHARQPKASRDTRMSVASPSHNLPLPFTYSIQEPTFARRLQRRSIEVAYQMLLNPNVPQTVKAQRFFRFSCYGVTQDRAIAALRKMLMRTTEEPLSCVAAGLEHDNRQILRPFMKSRNSVIYRTDHGWRVQSIDPPPQNPDVSTDRTLDLSSYNGEWFDSGDVEDYLQRRGVRLSESAYAEVDVPDGMVDELALQPTTPPVRDTYAEVGEDSIVSHAQPSSTISNRGIVTTTTRVHGPFGVIFDQAVSGKGAYGVEMSRTQTMTIDVSTLLDEITKRGVCLGGTPGFRRTDVDRAVRVALQAC